GRVDDALLIDREAGDLGRPRAGRDDDVLGDERGGAGRALDDDTMAVGAGLAEARLAHDDLGAVALEQGLDAAGQLVDDAALPGLQLLHVDGRLGGDRDAELVGVADLLERLGRVDDRLRRDAADVQADAAHVLALDDARLDLELPEPDAGRVPARTGA